MDSNVRQIFEDAVTLLHNLTTSHGILASTIEADNYKRVWARDSIICGIAGILLEDRKIIEGLKDSLLTLSGKQHELGMIPSNVLPGSNKEVSYGSLVGRVDTNTWFIIGACLYYLETNDKRIWDQLKPMVANCRDYLKRIEFNGKGWIYTPLSGNWADEYPVHGYTLYDNALRIWGERLWLKISGESSRELERLEHRTWANFWPAASASANTIYQTAAFKKAIAFNPEHFAAFILPGTYDGRFDAAGNALALLLNTVNAEQSRLLKKFLNSLKAEIGHNLIPAFWPVITESSTDWNLLRGNFSFEFKNTPGDFHNGGIWPVWMGLFCLGLRVNGFQKEVEEITGTYFTILSDAANWNFNEYLNANDLSMGGKMQMGYTAAGIVFMIKALEGDSISEKLHL